MNLVWGALVVLAATAVTVSAMLLVRRRAPEGSYFSDGDRASGVFGVLATGFSVLLGFIIFLAFTSYDQSRVGAETEALLLVQQVENAQLFPPESGRTLTGQLLCYARSVVHQEWPRMESGTREDTANPWALEMFATIRGVDPTTATQQSAYDKWLDQTSTREEARRDRLHGAAGVIPSPLWIVLFFISGVIFPIHAVPANFLPLLLVNPVMHLIELSRASFFPQYHVLPGINLAYPAGVALVFACLALSLYRVRRERLIAVT